MMAQIKSKIQFLLEKYHYVIKGNTNITKNIKELQKC